MRKIVFFIGLLCIGGIVYLLWSWQKQNEQILPLSSPPTPTPTTYHSPLTTNIPDATIDFNNKTYAIFIQQIENSQNLTLIPNFTQKLSAQELVKRNNCIYGINGGFYTTDNKPLGLFIADGKEHAPVSNSSLLNGFFWKDEDTILHSTNDAPTKPVIFALQTGPYFTVETNLRIIDDEYARRMMVAQDERGDFYFLAITDENNTNSGPLLGDLPDIIQELNKNSYDILHTTYNILLNLDGGSASAFYKENETILSELTTIGSWLCGR